MATQSRSTMDQTEPRKSGRGFAAMDAAKQREIASKGGKAAHESGRAHEFTSEEARVAGRKGGEAAHESGRAHEFTSEEARAAGRKGGEASHANRAMRAAALKAAKEREDAERGTSPLDTNQANAAGGGGEANPAANEGGEIKADTGADTDAGDLVNTAAPSTSPFGRN
jgi:general stress protein YciG